MVDALTSSTWDALGVVSAQLRRTFAASDSGLGFVALATLRHLARHGATGVSDLARSDRVSTQAISLRVAPLVEAGLAARAPDPADGRRTVLSITAAGAEVVDRAHRTALETLGHALEALDQGDREALAGALPALEAIGAHLQAQATGSVA